MPRRLLAATVLACVWLTVDVREAAACLCGGMANPCASLWFGDREPVLFEGTVESIERRVVDVVYDFDGDAQVMQREMKEVRFRDVRPMLGQRVNTVLTGSGGGDCGYQRFEVGARFVVHATEEREGLSTGTCSFTAPVGEAREILDYVASLSGPGAGARISGKIVLAKREYVGLPSVTNTPLPGVRLQLEGPVRRAAVSDDRGLYAFETLPPGHYEVALETDRTDLFGTGPRRQSVALRHAHACATTYTEFYANGAITGAVVDADGQPVANAAVSLRAADIAGQEHVGYGSSRTDADGRYRFQALGAGRYVIGVNLEWGMRKDSPWVPSLAIDERGAPAIVTLAHAEQSEAGPIVVRMPQSTTITGRLTRRDGRPMHDTLVRATSAGENYRHFGDSVEATTDDDGRFTFTLGAGQAYRIGSWPDEGSVEVDRVVTPAMHLPLVLRPRP
jgi:hypothetical protein